MTSEQAAYNIWPILTELARKEKDSVTYQELSAQIGRHHRTLSKPLELIQKVCSASSLPNLTVLVVLKTTGRPSTGFDPFNSEKSEEDFEAVRNYRWPDENPFSFAANGKSLKDLVSEIIREPGSGAAIYAQVPVRGIAQMVFRRAVINAYDRACAICGISYHQCLEASHIVPWAKATPQQRISPTNGLCLCANHHRLFDRGLVTIGPDHCVVYKGARDASYTDGDIALSVAHHGKVARLPKNHSLRPACASLAAHYADAGWDQPPWGLKF